MRRNASGGKVIDGIRGGLIGGDSGGCFLPHGRVFAPGAGPESGRP
jgi:hypothetical protein